MISHYIATWLLLVLFVVTYSSGTKVFQKTCPMGGGSKIFGNNSYLQHEEAGGGFVNWIKNSSVCSLGKLSFWVMSLFLLIYITVYTFVNEAKWKKDVRTPLFYTFITLWSLMGLAILIMNFPMFVRSIVSLILGILTLWLPFIF